MSIVSLVKANASNGVLASVTPLFGRAAQPTSGRQVSSRAVPDGVLRPPLLGGEPPFGSYPLTLDEAVELARLITRWI